MTRKTYTPEELDQLALRIFDMGSMVRRMSQQCEKHALETVDMHDKKAIYWLQNLEAWLAKGSADLDLQIIQAQAEQRARELDELEEAEV